MSLILHRGAELIEYGALKALPTPDPTETHVPIEHSYIVDIVTHMLKFHHHEVTEQHFGVTPDGSEFFGVLMLKSEYGDYVDQVGLRNSHSKKFSLGMAFGSRVTVCDNLAFMSSQVVQRKHSKKVRHELPMIISQMIEPLADARQAQCLAYERFRERLLSDAMADQLIMRMYREDVINLQRIPDVMQQWEEPECDWGEKTAWRLFNATTFAIKNKVMERPAATQTLHGIIDAVCV